MLHSPCFQVIFRAPATCTDHNDAPQVFDIEHPTIPGQTANPRPYCAQHFSKLGQPWGFKSLPIPGHRPGYPVWLDINLSHAEMRRWVALLDDGLFFDPATVAVTAEVLTYNAHTNLFAKATLLFQSDSGGAFQTYSNVNTLKVRGLTALPLLLLLRDCVDGSSSIAGGPRVCLLVRSACISQARAAVPDASGPRTTASCPDIAMCLCCMLHPGLSPTFHIACQNVARVGAHLTMSDTRGRGVREIRLQQHVASVAASLPLQGAAEILCAPSRISCASTS